MEYSFRYLLLASAAILQLNVGLTLPVDDFEIQVGTPLTAKVKLPRGLLHGSLDSSLPKSAIGSPCKSEGGSECWEWASEQQRVLIQDGPSSAATGNSNQCKTVVWLSQDVNKSPQHCWRLSDGAKWYGGGSAQNQKWPIVTDSFDEQPQITGGGRSDSEDTNNVHNRLWFSTAGVAIKVEDQVPLFVTVEGGNQLCFRSENKYPYVFDKNVPPTLSYAVCYGKNLTDLYVNMMSLFFEKPSMPHADLFRNPIWNTYPKLTTVNSVALQQYVDKIASVEFGTVGSVVLVGHVWTACTGEYKFDTQYFPNPGNLVKYMKDKLMHLGLWVHPHVSLKCDWYQDGARNGYFIQQETGFPTKILWTSTPGPKGQLVATVDFTNSESVEWFTKNLRNLMKQYGIEAFFFERGQAVFLPKERRQLKGPPEFQPDSYSTNYVQVAASLSNMSIVNVGRNTQQYPVLVRMPPKRDYAWSNDSIQSVIPSILQMGISGFPYILTEVVGGTYYTGDKPDRRLYIRWLQLSALMSTVHFSVGPWEYDDEVIKIANDLMAMRTEFMDLYIIPAAIASANDGTPMIRPVWWIAPDDPQAFMVDDQFLVGNSLLVAPVVDQTEYRDIYIPPGHWRSSLYKDEILKGPTILLNASVPLKKLAYFTAEYA